MGKRKDLNTSGIKTHNHISCFENHFKITESYILVRKLHLKISSNQNDYNQIDQKTVKLKKYYLQRNDGKYIIVKIRKMEISIFKFLWTLFSLVIYAKFYFNIFRPTVYMLNL